MAERSGSDISMPGTHTPGSPSSRDERYNARTTHKHGRHPERGVHPGRFDASPGHSGPPSTGSRHLPCRGGNPLSNQKPLLRTPQALSRIRGPPRATARFFANTAWPCKPTTSSWSSNLERAPSSCLGYPPPQPSPRIHSRRHIRLQLQPRPLRPNRSCLPPPRQPSVPVTSRAQSLQVAPTHASAMASGTTNFRVPLPTQPVTTTYQMPAPAQPSPPPTPLASSRPTILPGEAID